MAPPYDDDNKKKLQQGRRALMKGGLAAVPVILTLRGRPLHASSGMGTLGDYTGYDLGDSGFDDPYTNNDPYGSPGGTNLSDDPSQHRGSGNGGSRRRR